MTRVLEVTQAITKKTVRLLSIDLTAIEAMQCCVAAVDRSAYFDVDPLPDGLWRISMKNEPGHSPLTGRGEGATPWYWGKTLEEARKVCAAANLRRGITEEDAIKIVTSSMFHENRDACWLDAFNDEGR